MNPAIEAWHHRNYDIEMDSNDNSSIPSVQIRHAGILRASSILTAAFWVALTIILIAF